MAIWKAGLFWASKTFVFLIHLPFYILWGYFSPEQLTENCQRHLFSIDLNLLLIGQLLDQLFPRNLNTITNIVPRWLDYQLLNREQETFDFKRNLYTNSFITPIRSDFWAY